MAYTIKSQPTTPNCTYTSLVYNVSSSNATNPQFNYLMDVYESGSATRLARIRQFPNPSLEAVFDPSRIFNDNLEYSVDFGGNYIVTDRYQVKNFNVEFGEEYGTSPSSSVTTYPNQANNIIEVFPCQINPNNGSSYNFLGSGSAVTLSDRPDGVPEYVGAYYRMAFYNGTGVTLVVTGSGYTGGPDNAAIVSSGDIVSMGPYVLLSDGEVLTLTYNGESVTREFKDACNYPVYNFMFINKYGMWENFSTALPVRGNISLDRENYEQTFVNYSNTGAYDIERRGETNYSTGITEDLTISTDWLSKEAAQWITQLIESDEVYVAVSPDNTVFKPIVITNASYVQNTGRKDQKTFMYDITFRYANQRIGR